MKKRNSKSNKEMFHVKQRQNKKEKRKPDRSLAGNVSRETSNILHCKVNNLNILVNIELQHVFNAVFEGYM